MLSRITKGLTRLSEFIGNTVSYLTLLMVVGMFLSSFLSNFFQINFIALQESVTWTHAAVFLLAAGYTLHHNEHVRVDVFHHRFSERVRQWIELSGSLFLLLPTSVFIFWSSWRYVALSWQLKEASAEAGGLPGVFLLKSLVLVMATLLILEAINQIILTAMKLNQTKQQGVK